ncbi:MAG: pyridoxal phosphate-dependent aminotransferase [Candidatus Hodarchaeota archaeon]
MLQKIHENALNLEKEGKKLTKLNVGEPDQSTPCEIIDAAYVAMKEGKTRYSFATGEEKLRAELASLHGVSEANVVITPGSKWAIFTIIYLLLQNGGNIVIPSPYWTPYVQIAKYLGKKVRFLRTDIEQEWQLNIEALEELIDSQTRLLILNSPNNPTSKVIDEKTLTEIVELANNKKIMILSDEVYSGISFAKSKSIVDLDDNHILTESFSKTFGMTGWRIGYVIAEKSFIEKVTQLNQLTLTNVPVFIQEAAMKALELREKLIAETREIYRSRADLACRILSNTELKFIKPDAPFYIFAKYENLDSEEFLLKMLDKGVVLAPGTAFGNYRDHFRIALTIPEKEIKLALKTIVSGLESL